MSFKPSGGHKLVKNSEFQHFKDFDDHHPGAKNIPVNFLARSKPELFERSFVYSEDPHERKED